MDFFEREIVKNYSLENSLFIQVLCETVILAPERHIGDILQKYSKLNLYWLNRLNSSSGYTV